MTTRARPICFGCKHFLPDEDGLRCAAFGKRPIPVEIVRNEFDHRKRHLFDGGVVFDPKDDASEAYARRMFER